MCNTMIGLFCAQQENWEELLTAAPYHLKISRDNGYIMFKYDQIHSNFVFSLVQEARGIIFKEGQWDRPVCWAFNKFGNYGESYVPEIDWSTACVTEKVDGSLIKLWYNCGGWHISTNGTIDAFKAPLNDVKYNSFGDYFIDTLKKYYPYESDFIENLDEKCTYMFELVGPSNRVVVPYEESKIYFLGVRNNWTGQELSWNIYDTYAFRVDRFEIPKQYPLTSLAECIKVAEEFDWQQEGFVVCDGYFNRVKVKSPAYILAHYTRNNNVITKKHLIKVVLANEVEEFICYASEYKEEVLKCKTEIETFYWLGELLLNICHQVRRLLRKEYAEMVKACPAPYWDFLFRNYERDISIKEYVSKWTPEKWEEALNQLNKEIG